MSKLALTQYEDSDGICIFTFKEPVEIDINKLDQDWDEMYKQKELDNGKNI